MAIENGELMHKCFPKHPRMGTARWQEGKKRRINVERSTADTKERSPVHPPCRVVTSVTHDSQSPLLYAKNIPAFKPNNYTNPIYFLITGSKTVASI